MKDTNTSSKEGFGENVVIKMLTETTTSKMVLGSLGTAVLSVVTSFKREKYECISQMMTSRFPDGHKESSK